MLEKISKYCQISNLGFCFTNMGLNAVGTSLWQLEKIFLTNCLFSELNLIQNWHFYCWWRMGGGGGPKRVIPKICHTYPTMKKLGTVIPYLKKIQKIYESRDTPPDSCWHQHFFTGNQQILLYQEIQIQIAFWYIISNSFNFSWVFKDFFNKPGYNFDDVSKNGYPRPS